MAGAGTAAKVSFQRLSEDVAIASAPEGYFLLVRHSLAPRRGRAASRGGMHHASDAFTMVREREIVRVRPAAVALVEHRAPDVVGILRTSARTHPCSAGVTEIV